MKNLVGKQFGYLKVIEEAQRVHYRSVWSCMCKCGNKVLVTGNDLISGHTKSCGCYRKEKSNYMHLENKVYNGIQVLRKTDKRDYKGSIIWNCKCLYCGNELELSQDAIVHGNYKSCGCLKKIQASKLNEKLHFYNGTCLEFLEKRSFRKDNTTGSSGVYKTSNGKYKSVIGFMNKRYYLGTFTTKEEAVQTRMHAQKVLHEAFISKYRAWINANKNLNEFKFEVKFVNKEFIIHSN